MTDVFATIIVSAAQAQAARDAAAQIPGGEGMLTAGLSATGAEPATHYIASGWMPEELVQALSMCSVSDLPPAEVIEQAGLKPCAQP